MLPGPSCVAAALLLVVGVGREAGHQQTRVAVGPERGVNLKQIAFAGFNGQPIDEFAYQVGIHLGGALVFILVDKHNVKIAAVAKFFSAQFAVRDDCQFWCCTVLVLQPLPAPVKRDG